MVFDIIFAVQHYVLYPSRGGEGEESVGEFRSGEEDLERLLQQHQGGALPVNGSKENPRSP